MPSQVKAAGSVPPSVAAGLVKVNRDHAHRADRPALGDEQPLGTAGPIGLLTGVQADDRILVVNGDTLTVTYTFSLTAT